MCQGPDDYQGSGIFVGISRLCSFGGGIGLPFDRCGIGILFSVTHGHILFSAARLLVGHFCRRDLRTIRSFLSVFAFLLIIIFGFRVIAFSYAPYVYVVLTTFARWQCIGRSHMVCACFLFSFAPYLYSYNVLMLLYVFHFLRIISLHLVYMVLSLFACMFSYVRAASYSSCCLECLFFLFETLVYDGNPSCKVVSRGTLENHFGKT